MSCGYGPSPTNRRTRPDYQTWQAGGQTGPRAQRARGHFRLHGRQSESRWRHRGPDHSFGRLGEQVILLDTHVLIWMSSEPKRLSKKAREAIREARQKTGIAAASITLWELAWLAENRRILVSGIVDSFVRETISRVIVMPMSPEIVALAVRLPSDYPKDPADRLIASTAIVDGIPLVTADERVRQAKVVQTIW